MNQRYYMTLNGNRKSQGHWDMSQFRKSYQECRQGFKSVIIHVTENKL